MSRDYLGQFFAEESEWRRQLTNLSDYLYRRFSSSGDVYLKESEADIDNENQDWQLISLSFNKQKIFSVLKVSSYSVNEIYHFNEEKHAVMKEVCYIFGLPPDEGLQKMKQESVVTVEILHPPRLDDEVKRFFDNEEVRKSLESENLKNNKLRHLIFLLYLKKRRDMFKAILEYPKASNNMRAVFFARLWTEIGKDEINEGISFLAAGISAAKKLLESESSKGEKERKRIKCPHCKKEFTEKDRANYVLSGKGLLFEFFATDYIHGSINPYPYRPEKVACPLCSTGIDAEKLAKGEYDVFSRPVWSQCFVASTVFSSNSTEVENLRELRDTWLVNIFGGETFIRIYHKIGPYLAMVVSKSRFLKRITMKILNLVIYIWSARNGDIIPRTGKKGS